MTEGNNCKECERRKQSIESLSRCLNNTFDGIVEVYSILRFDMKREDIEALEDCLLEEFAKDAEIMSRLAICSFMPNDVY